MNSTLELADNEAAVCSFNNAEALEYVRRGGDTPGALKTTESVAAELSAAFAFLLARWR